MQPAFNTPVLLVGLPWRGRSLYLTLQVKRKRMACCGENSNDFQGADPELSFEGKPLFFTAWWTGFHFAGDHVEEQEHGRYAGQGTPQLALSPTKTTSIIARVPLTRKGFRGMGDVVVAQDEGIIYCPVSKVQTSMYLLIGEDSLADI